MATNLWKSVIEYRLSMHYTVLFEAIQESLRSTTTKRRMASQLIESGEL